jgi:tRNA threonylcarbamoyl adenosine modification protein YeaZ
MAATGLTGSPASEPTVGWSVVRVLAIDTSSPAVTAAVVFVGADGLEVVAARAPIAARGHGELLSPAIAECLDEAGCAPKDIAAVVAGAGPGPYTGLRVGLVTAAAFADAVGAPTYPVCSLDAIAVPCPGGSVVVTYARRREVYWAAYDDEGRRRNGPHVTHPTDVDLNDVSHLAGAAVELYEWPALPVLADRYPRPESVVALALDRIRGGAAAEALRPIYLRRPDAVVPSAPKSVIQ